MRILIVVAVVLSLLVTIFAVQNNQPTPVRFLFWSVEGSFALVLMVTLVLGILIGVLLMTPGSVRNRLRIAELRRGLRSIEAERPAMPAEPGEPQERAAASEADPAAPEAEPGGERG